MSEWLKRITSSAWEAAKATGLLSIVAGAAYTAGTIVTNSVVVGGCAVYDYLANRNAAQEGSADAGKPRKKRASE